MNARRGPHESTLEKTAEREPSGAGGGDARMGTALVLVWSHDEPERVGEVALVPPGARGVAFSVGRSMSSGTSGVVPLGFARLRPHEVADTGPLRAARVSRWHLQLRVDEDGALSVEHPGRGVLAVNGVEHDRATVRHGDVVESVDRFMLLVSARPLAWPRLAACGPAFPFGEADPHGLVGESPEAWALRRQVAFVAARSEPVLIHGPSGSGKELVVRALHAASSRGAAELVARNAATLPEALIDAELFGNLKNYPNPGMPDRPGLVGEADGSTLFLDEIGELPAAMQARLLRVMDRGEYQRLGESRRRTTRARLVGATNRDLGELKHDLLARFTHRVELPGLDERPCDVALIARHLLLGFAAEDPTIRARFFHEREPRLDARLSHALVQTHYTTHVRELAEILWRSIAASTGDTLVPPPGLRPQPPPVAVDASELTRDTILEVLARCRGVRERAWRELGLRSRHQLKRLLARHNID